MRTKNILYVGDVIWYDMKKYKVVSRKERLYELRECGYRGLFKQNRQIHVNSNTKYQLVK